MDPQLAFLMANQGKVIVLIMQILYDYSLFADRQPIQTVV